MTDDRDTLTLGLQHIRHTSKQALSADFHDMDLPKLLGFFSHNCSHNCGAILCLFLRSKADIKVALFDKPCIVKFPLLIRTGQLELNRSVSVLLFCACQGRNMSDGRYQEGEMLHKLTSKFWRIAGTSLYISR